MNNSMKPQEIRETILRHFIDTDKFQRVTVHRDGRFTVRVSHAPNEAAAAIEKYIPGSKCWSILQFGDRWSILFDYTPLPPRSLPQPQPSQIAPVKADPAAQNTDIGKIGGGDCITFQTPIGTKFGIVELVRDGRDRYFITHLNERNGELVKARTIIQHEAIIEKADPAAHQTEIMAIAIASTPAYIRKNIGSGK